MVCISYSFSLEKVLQKLVLWIKINIYSLKINISLIQLIYVGMHRTFNIPYKIRAREETIKNYEIMKINKTQWNGKKSHNLQKLSLEILFCIERSKLNLYEDCFGWNSWNNWRRTVFKHLTLSPLDIIIATFCNIRYSHFTSCSLIFRRRALNK